MRQNKEDERLRNKKKMKKEQRETRRNYDMDSRSRMYSGMWNLRQGRRWQRVQETRTRGERDC